MRFGHCTLDGCSGHEAGRALLERLFWEETGEPMPEIYIERWGKPYFRGRKYHFSISHTRNHVFCAVSRNPVGVDAEELGRRVPDSLVRRVLSPTEMEQYKEAVNKNRAFLTFWVLKEAQVKLSGRGLQGFPNRTEFRLDDSRVQEVDGCLVAVMEEETYAV